MAVGNMREHSLWAFRGRERNGGTERSKLCGTGTEPVWGACSEVRTERSPRKGVETGMHYLRSGVTGDGGDVAVLGFRRER